MTTSHSAQIPLPYTRFRIRDKNIFLRRKLLDARFNFRKERARNFPPSRAGFTLHGTKASHVIQRKQKVEKSVKTTRRFRWHHCCALPLAFKTGVVVLLCPLIA